MGLSTVRTHTMSCIAMTPRRSTPDQEHDLTHLARAPLATFIIRLRVEFGTNFTMHIASIHWFLPPVPAYAPRQQLRLECPQISGTSKIPTKLHNHNLLVWADHSKTASHQQNLMDATGSHRGLSQGNPDFQCVYEFSMLEIDGSFFVPCNRFSNTPSTMPINPSMLSAIRSATISCSATSILWSQLEASPVQLDSFVVEEGNKVLSLSFIKTF